MDPRGDEPAFDSLSDRARIDQATGMLMQLYGLSAGQALVLLQAVSRTNMISTSSVARTLVEEWCATS